MTAPIPPTRSASDTTTTTNMMAKITTKQAKRIATSGIPIGIAAIPIRIHQIDRKSCLVFDRSLNKLSVSSLSSVKEYSVKILRANCLGVPNSLSISSRL